MLKPGDEPVPGYRLEAFLGKGQYGEVWRARSPGGAKAALKFLDLGGRAGWKEFRAIQRVKAIRHANLMPITALWVLDDQGRLLDDSVLESFVEQNSAIMETGRNSEAVRATAQADSPGTPLPRPRQLVVASLLGDRNMLELLREYQERGEGGIPVEELLAYMEQAAKGIDFLNSTQHDLGQGPVAIQHCDIKPENIMLVGNSVLVCDFGLASVLADARSAATATGMVGSLAYMSPECTSRKPSAASDQYSLAISYAELRSGDLPFTEKSFAEVLDSVRNSKLDWTNIPPDEQRVLKRATSLMPGDRYPNAAAMVADLRRANERATGVDRHPRQRSVLPAFFAALAMGGVAVAVVALVFPGKNGGGPPPEPPQYTLEITPADPGLQVELDGQSLVAAEPGKFVFPFSEQTNSTLVASLPPDYRRETLVVSKQADHRLQLVLRPSATWLQSEAYATAGRGDWPEAVRQLAEAIQVDESPEKLVSRLPEATTIIQVDHPFSSVCVSPDRRTLLTATETDKKLRVWSLPSSPTSAPKLAEYTLPGTVQRLTCNAQVAAGSYLVHDSRETAEHPEVFMTTDYAQPNSARTERFPVASLLEPPVAVDTDGKRVVTAVADRENPSLSRLFVISFAADLPVKTQVSDGTQESMVSQLIVNPQGDAAVTLGFDEQARRWDRSGNGPPTIISDNAGGALVNIPTLDAFALGVQQGNSYQIQVVPWDSKQSPRSLPGLFTSSINCLGVNADGKWLAAGTSNGAVMGWNLDQPEPESRRLPDQMQDAIGQLVFAPQSGWLITVPASARNMMLWNLNSPRLDRSLLLPTDQSVEFATVTPDGLIVAVQKHGQVIAWDFLQCALLCDALSVDPSTVAPAAGP